MIKENMERDVAQQIEETMGNFDQLNKMFDDLNKADSEG